MTTSFDAGIAPTQADSYAFSGLVSADENGVISLDCGPNENTAEQSGLNNPYGFLNAIVLSTDTPHFTSYRPDPEDGAIINEIAVGLNWQYGQTSVSSDFYFGDSYDAVNNATKTAPEFRGNIITKPFWVGSTGNPYPDGLTPGQTYYWRTDEIEDDGTAYKGDIWSFTVAPPTAFLPDPIDGAIYIDPNGTLRWTSGSGAVEHHVYLGDNLTDVTAGTGDTYKGVVLGGSDPNFYPGLLELNTTYYWRIDENDGAETHTGEVWSYTTTLEGLGEIPMEVWTDVAGDHLLSNLLEDPRYPGRPNRTEMLTAFDSGNGVDDGYGARIYGWLYVPVSGDYTFYFTSAGQGEFRLSTDNSPANAQLLLSEPTWGDYSAFTHKSDPVSLVAGNKYYIEAIWKDFGSWDHCRAAWEGPGIRGQQVINGSFLSAFMPTISYNAYPGNGGTGLSMSPIFTWTSGIYAEKHNVYVGADFNDVNEVTQDNLASYPDVNAFTVTEGMLAPGVLDPNTVYYWRIDDVNTAESMVWKGDIMSFTTSAYLIIDDFETYNDLNENEEGSNRIYLTWSDGYDNPTVNGGTIGYPAPDLVNGESFVETNIVRGGSQSGPLVYNITTASYAEVSLSTSQMTIGSDWTQKGIDTLSIWFYGDPNNTGTEQLYVKLNDFKLPITSVDLTVAAWQNAYIPLADFGINLTNVTHLAIGLDKNGAGSEGILFMDDIRLYNSLYSTTTVPMIVYVDATGGGNTMLATGEVLTSVDSDSGSDNLWRGRVFANSGTVFEAGGQYGDTVNTEDCPRLMTSVNVPEGSYEVYAYFWDDGSGWRIRASLTDSGDDLPLFVANDPNSGATLAVAEDFGEPVPMLVEGNRTLWQANLGITGNTSNITIYIDDEAAHMSGNARTWYDGIGYKAVLSEE
ncbi:MAG: hypothetical protein JW715_03380 [Sedimentisphaerales bacterium]|nr:hypothetical protein [Sedimentisphaerales bacterium]